MQPERIITIPYTPRRLFNGLHARKQRWAVAVAHRRAGKTVATINDLTRGAAMCRQREPRFAYVAPYFSQAKDVAWSYLKHYTAPIPGVAVNESELRVDLPNGGRVRLYGADNYERLRGLYFDGLVLDEYGDMDPRAWTEVLRATLADRQGWAVFIGTPRGANHFAEMWDRARSADDWYSLELKASETGLIPQAELDEARKDMGEEVYLAEFECSFAASVVGSFFAKEMQAAEADGRVTRVKYQPELAVDTWWDLGVRDAMSIWFTQSVGREIHCIDYYEASGEGLPHYAKVLQERGYVYGQHNAPHDIRVQEMGTGRTRIETAFNLGIRFQIVPNIPREDGIEAARSFLARCWFDRAATERGRMALTSYRKVWDERRRVFQAQPLHDWASNGCFAGETGVLTRNGTCRIMDLPEGGEVLTPCGYRRYEGPFLTKKNARLVEVAFSGGLTVRCTPEHLFLTVRGWRYAKSLQKGSVIQSSLTRSPNTLMAAYIGYGLVRDISRAAAACFIATCGRLLSVPSPRHVMCTIGMETSSRMGWPTWNACQQASIFPSSEMCTNEPDAGLLRSRLSEPLTGTGQKRVGCGIAGMPSERKDGPSGGAIRLFAHHVALSFKLLCERAGIRNGFVRPDAKLLRIASVAAVNQRADVWDITVPGGGWFSLANGAVVHNSDAFRYLAVGHKTAPYRQPSEPPRRPMIEIGGGSQQPSTAWLGV